MKLKIKRIVLIFLLLLIMLVPIVRATSDTYEYTIKGIRDYKKAYEISEMINAERKKRGLAEYKIDHHLMERAMHRAAEIAVHYDSNHLRPNGEIWYSLLDTTRFFSGGENIAAHQSSTQEVMNAWMNSPGHKANILDENGYGFNTMGIGVFKSELGLYYWVQWFGGTESPKADHVYSNMQVNEVVEVKYGVLPFWDVNENDYFYNALCYNVANKYILGYNSNVFGPSYEMTRGMVVTVLYRMEGTPYPDGDKILSDINGDEYYAKAVKWAVNNGVVNGYADGTFKPNKNVTRQELIVILRNYLRYKQGADAVKVKDNGTFEKFADINNVDDYAKSAVMWAVENTVIRGRNSNGKTYIDPQGVSIRADVACMFYNYAKAYFPDNI